MIRAFVLAQLTVVLMAVAPLLGACGSDESPPPAPAPANSALAGALSASDNQVTSTSANAVPCTDKQVRECRVELGQQGTVQNCFVGLELCSNGAWGPCLSAAEIEAQLNSQ
jgi:hypothetical protein